MLDIMSDMLTESQMHKKDVEHLHDYVEVCTSITNGACVININHSLEDMETLCDNVISKDESLLLLYASNSKVYGLFTKSTQSIDDMTLIMMKSLISFVLMYRKVLLTNKEALCYLLKKMVVLVILKLLILLPILEPSEATRLLCILKSKLFQMDLESVSLNRYLNVEVEDFHLATIMKRIM